MNKKQTINCRRCNKLGVLILNNKNMLSAPKGWSQEVIPDRLVGGYKATYLYTCPICSTKYK